ncbi:MAG: hypothetical protein ACLFTI_02765 [Anaerolineales bacterium]
MFKKIVSAVAGLALLVMVTSIVLAAWTPEDFNTFDGSGFVPSPAAGQLDSDAWRVTGLSDGDGTFGGTHDSDDFARGASQGGVTTGGVYAFEVATDNHALGVQPAGSDFTPGEFTLRVQNNTGATVSDIYVEYTIWVYNNEGRSNSFNFAHSTDDTTYTSVSALDYTSPEVADTSPAWVSENKSTTITGLSLADGDYFYLQWQGDDVEGSGSRDEFALDDVEVRVDNATAVTFSSVNALSPFVALSAVMLLAAGLVLLRR